MARKKKDNGRILDPLRIRKDQSKAFNRIVTAIKSQFGTVALVSVREAATGEQAAVIALVYENDDGFIVEPVALLFDKNHDPFKMFDPPSPDDDVAVKPEQDSPAQTPKHSA